MKSLSSIFDKKIFPGDVFNREGIIDELSLIFVLMFVFLIPWGQSISVSLPANVGLVSFVLTFAALVVSGSHKKYTIYHFFVLLFWVWALVSVMWSPDLGDAQKVAKTAFQIMLLPFLFTLVIHGQKRILLAYQAYVLGNVVGSFIIMSNYLNGIMTNYYDRYGIANMETDILGVVLALALPMAAYLSAALPGKYNRLFYTFSIPVIYYAIFLTGTRTATIVGLFGIGYWLFTYRKSPISTKLAILGTAVCFIAVVISIVPKASLDRAMSSGKSISAGTLNDRTTIWQSSLAQWEDVPGTGVGLGGLRAALSRENVGYAGAHNVYIEVLTEMGIVGLTLYLIIILTLIIHLLKAPVAERFFLLSLLMIVLVSQSVQHTHLLKETWFVLTMIIIHSRYCFRDEAKLA